MARDDKSVLVDVWGKEAVAFATGKIALMVTYLNRLEKPAVARMADEYGIIMPPKGPDAEDYISDMNWLCGYVVLKNCNNPGGAFEFASIFFKPYYALSFKLQDDLFTAQAITFKLDEQSIEIMKKIPAINHSTSYQIYFSTQFNGNSIGNICCYQLSSFVDGSLSPETYYASMESVANAIMDGIMGLL